MKSAFWVFAKIELFFDFSHFFNEVDCRVARGGRIRSSHSLATRESSFLCLLIRDRLLTFGRRY